ncbi:hypothetical protein GCM10010232_39570 [Streptomyces amakusaensis]|uniref:DUF6397 family protein n=1 Tax=Streptomyces amakusaensis TaxID=67271 RepID=A0ABW0APH9_9ACTN
MTVREGLTAAGAARLLELKQSEFDLAIRLGHIRAVSRAAGGPARVARAEIERLRGAPGFPKELRERVRTAGTGEGARLLAISPGRFTRLARTGHFAPVVFYLNRYHAVVWLYLVEELEDFAADHPDLLSGRTPPAQRAMLDEGEDRRARTWRGRLLELLLREARDPWERAAAVAAVLDPDTVAEVVTDPGERETLRLLRPELVPVRPLSPAAQDVVDRLRLADHPSEILRHRMSLALAVREARLGRSGPGAGPVAGRGAGVVLGPVGVLGVGRATVPAVPVPAVSVPARGPEPVPAGRVAAPRRRSRGRSLFKRLWPRGPRHAVRPPRRDS